MAIVQTAIEGMRLSRDVQGPRVTRTGGKKSSADEYSSCVRQTLVFLHRHFQEPLTWEDVAHSVSRHKRYIATTFRRETGMTMRQYLRQLRIQHATELIESGDKVESTMLAVGYRSKRAFYSHFRQQWGVTPGAYRTRVR